VIKTGIIPIKGIHCITIVGTGLYKNGGQMLNFISAVMHDVILNVNLKKEEGRSKTKERPAGV